MDMEIWTIVHILAARSAINPMSIYLSQIWMLLIDMEVSGTEMHMSCTWPNARHIRYVSDKYDTSLTPKAMRLQSLNAIVVNINR